MSNAHLAGQYYTRFQAQKSVIDNLLAAQDATSTTSAAQEIQAVKKSLTDATTFLPPYDQRRYQDQIKEWERALQQNANSGGDASKKPRFAFKKRVPTRVEETTNAPLGTDDKQPLQQPSTSAVEERSADPSPTNESEQITLRGATDRRITLDELLATSHDITERTGFSLVLEDIQGCVVDLCDHGTAEEGGEGKGKRLTALYGANVKDSVIAVPDDVAGSVMLDRIERVVVVTGCQQVRPIFALREVRCTDPVDDSSGYIPRIARYCYYIFPPTPSSNIPPPSASDGIRQTYGKNRLRPFWCHGITRCRTSDGSSRGRVRISQVLTDEVADEVGVRVAEVLDGDKRWQERLGELLKML
ncbi:hypothetical protein QFC20_004854 [Naganishia adeliensis]|uniref:Uncharacterized protein n=1 Tax=Naganishia adeliensis TaxID=92952 RepID=A0ACC2VUC7_9TREE|nr:hypothetical protein QFC20_004854 [Naganishia adeliensis]